MADTDGWPAGDDAIHESESALRGVIDQLKGEIQRLKEECEIKLSQERQNAEQHEAELRRDFEAGAGHMLAPSNALVQDNHDRALAEAADAGEQLARLSAEHQSALAARDEHVKQLESANSDLLRRIAELSLSLAQTGGKEQSSEEVHSQAKAQYDALECELQSARAEAAKVQARLDAELQSVRSDTANAIQQKDLECQRASLAEQLVQSLRAELETNVEKTALFTLANKANNDARTVQAQELDACKAELAVEEAAVSAERLATAKVRGELSECLAMRDEAVISQLTAGELAGELEARAASLSTELQESQNSLSEAETAKNSVLQEVQALRIQCAGLHDDLGSLRLSFKEVEMKRENAQQEVATSSAECERLRGQADVLGVTLLGLQHEVDQLAQLNKSLNERIQENLRVALADGTAIGELTLQLAAFQAQAQTVAVQHQHAVKDHLQKIESLNGDLEAVGHESARFELEAKKQVSDCLDRTKEAEHATTRATLLQQSTLAQLVQAEAHAQGLMEQLQVVHASWNSEQARAKAVEVGLRADNEARATEIDYLRQALQAGATQEGRLALCIEEERDRAAEERLKAAMQSSSREGALLQELVLVRQSHEIEMSNERRARTVAEVAEAERHATEKRILQAERTRMTEKLHAECADMESKLTEVQSKAADLRQQLDHATSVIEDLSGHVSAAKTEAATQRCRLADVLANSSSELERVRAACEHEMHGASVRAMSLLRQHWEEAGAAKRDLQGMISELTAALEVKQIDIARLRADNVSHVRIENTLRDSLSESRAALAHALALSSGETGSRHHSPQAQVQSSVVRGSPRMHQDDSSSQALNESDLAAAVRDLQGQVRLLTQRQDVSGTGVGGGGLSLGDLSTLSARSPRPAVVLASPKKLDEGTQTHIQAQPIRPAADAADSLPGTAVPLQISVPVLALRRLTTRQ